jgi:F-type H+-transporting ATPase subunit b
MSGDRLGREGKPRRTRAIRSLLSSGFLALVTVAVAAPAWAQEEGGTGTWLGVPRVVWYSLNLILFLGLLGWLLAKPMAKFFRSRQEEIAESLAEARRQREEAARMKTEMEQRLASLEGEISALRERLRQEGEHEREALARQGEQDAHRLLAQLDEEATRRVEEARTTLAREAAGVAAELAWELLQREVTPEDRERIFRTTLDRLRTEAKGGAR